MKGRVLAWLGGAEVALLIMSCGAGEQAPIPDFPVPTVELEIGELEGSNVFGLVEDIQPVGGGQFVVLDSRPPTLTLFDPEGRPLATIGRSGEGPGEFRSPVALASDGARLYVLDARGLQIHEYAVAEGDLEFVRSRRLPFTPRDLCVLEGRLYVAMLHEGNTLHELSPEGEILRSFGEPYLVTEVPPGPVGTILQEIMSVGFIACAEEARLVITLGFNGPEVRAYSAEGELRWATTLSGHSTIRPRATNRGTVALEPDPRTGGVHETVGLATTHDRVLAQLVLTVAGTGDEERPVDTRVLSLATGEEVGETRELPRTTSVREGRYYAYRNDPYPQVVVLREQRQ